MKIKPPVKAETVGNVSYYGIVWIAGILFVLGFALLGTG